MGRNETLQQVTRWCGFTASVLIFALGIVHVSKVETNVQWPRDDFLDDTHNQIAWRFSLFTFIPDRFCKLSRRSFTLLSVDMWTPTFFGAGGVLLHIDAFHGPFFAKSFLRYCVSSRGEVCLLNVAVADFPIHQRDFRVHWI